MNFLAWKRGPFGAGVASLEAMDPQQSMDWKMIEQTLVQIVKLTGVEQEMSIDSLIVLHPCPAYEVL